jgi:hypothetical protein
MQTFLVILAVCLLTGFTGIAALNKWFRKGSDSKARRAHWQQFDDTHHWDASADDWVRNDGQRPD